MPASVKTPKKPAPKLSVVATSKAAPAKPKKTAVNTQARSRKPKSNSGPVPDEQRRHYVEVAAYYIAERRGFQGGNELEDWIQAEIEVERLLRDNLINA